MQKPERPEDFIVRPILHAGEGPVDIDPRHSIEVIGAHTARRALESIAGDMVRDECDGDPAFYDDADSLTYYLAVDDCNGNRTHHRVTARLKVVFDVDVIAAPPEPEAEVSRG